MISNVQTEAAGKLKKKKNFNMTLFSKPKRIVDDQIQRKIPITLFYKLF